MRRLTPVAWVAALAAALALPHPAVAAGGSPANSAVEVNTANGSSVFDLAFQVRTVSGDVVAPTNTALAYASCTDCQTVAIAIQIVFVEGNPSTSTPQNVAEAVNYQCTLCDTLAVADQFVVNTGGPVRLTRQGLDEIRTIRRELDQLVHQGARLSIAEIQSRVDVIVGRIGDVLASDVVPAGPPRQADAGPSGAAAPSGGASPAAAASGSAAPQTGQASAGPSAAGSAAPTGSSSGSASPPAATGSSAPSAPSSQAPSSQAPSSQAPASSAPRPSGAASGGSSSSGSGGSGGSPAPGGSGGTKP